MAFGFLNDNNRKKLAIDVRQDRSRHLNEAEDNKVSFFKLQVALRRTVRNCHSLQFVGILISRMNLRFRELAVFFRSK